MDFTKTFYIFLKYDGAFTIEIQDDSFKTISQESFMTYELAQNNFEDEVAYFGKYENVIAKNIVEESGILGEPEFEEEYSHLIKKRNK